MTIDEVFNLTQIDQWFLAKLYRIHTVDQQLPSYCLEDLAADKMRALKTLGFSDRHIASRLRIHCTQDDVRNHRILHNVRPSVKQIDTLAAEYPADTNYLYLTYQGIEHDVEPLSSSQCYSPMDSPRKGHRYRSSSVISSDSNSGNN